MFAQNPRAHRGNGRSGLERRGARVERAGARPGLTVRADDTLWSIASSTTAGDPRGGVWKIEQAKHLRVADGGAAALVLP